MIRYSRVIQLDTTHEAVNNRIGVRHGTEQTQKTA